MESSLLRDDREAAERKPRPLRLAAWDDRGQESARLAGAHAAPSARARIRAVPYYVGDFDVGTGLAFVISGRAAARYGWRVAFVGRAIGSMGAAILVTIATRDVAVEPDLELSDSDRARSDGTLAVKLIVVRVHLAGPASLC